MNIFIFLSIGISIQYIVLFIEHSILTTDNLQTKHKDTTNKNDSNLHSIAYCSVQGYGFAPLTFLPFVLHSYDNVAMSIQN